VNNYKCYLYGFGNIIYNNKSIDGNGYIYDVSNATSIEGYPSYSGLDYTVTTNGNIYNNTGTLKAGNPQFANSANPSGADNQWLTFDDGLKLQGSSPAFDFVLRALPPDHCDADDDGNTNEGLPYDAEGFSFASTTPYQAGAYQSIGITKNISLKYNQSGFIELTYDRAKGGTQIDPYLYFFNNIFQIIEESSDLINWNIPNISNYNINDDCLSEKDPHTYNFTTKIYVNNTQRKFFRLRYSEGYVIYSSGGIPQPPIPSPVIGDTGPPM
jgi:hypothetical protein